MRVYFTNMGCKLNQAEVEDLSRRFQGSGHEVVADLAEADFHVINTCTVTHVAAREARKLARRGARVREDLKTVVTGCYASEKPEEAAGLEGVDLVVTNDRKHRLLDEVHAAFPEIVPSNPAELAVPYVPLEFGHARAMVKIGDGCNMRCSFCIIPFTRGREQFRPIPEIVDEVRRLVASGYREVVVTGVQISSYRLGKDRLYDVARALLDDTEVERLRLTSIAPWRFDRRLFPLFEDPRLCRHIHMSLQSGSTPTLERMRRAYTAEAYAELLAEIRQRVPGVGITTDVIVGFPGETEEEFADSLAFVQRADFARTHVFPFSPREGTAAADLPNPVDHAIQRQRMKVMLEAATHGERRFWQAHLGQQLDVLWENVRDGHWQGLTDNYIRVFTPAERNLKNRVTRTRLAGMGEQGMVGEIEAAVVVG